jgi:dolichol-phosphate mannosyltransferase
VKIIVIIPAYNEERKVGRVVQKVLKYNSSLVDEVLVVNDASNDETSIEAEKAGATVVSHKNNMGAGSAIRTGIIYAIKKRYDVCVTMGADDQDNPSEIPRLIEPILNDEYDFVQGSRYLNYQRTVNMPLSRAITTRLYTLFFRFVSGFPVTDGSNGFRAFRISIFERINISQENLNKYGLEPYIFLQVIKRGFKVKEVPVTKRFDPRKGYSKMIPIKDWYSISKPLFTQFWKNLNEQF